MAHNCAMNIWTCSLVSEQREITKGYIIGMRERDRECLKCGWWQIKLLHHLYVPNITHPVWQTPKSRNDTETNERKKNSCGWVKLPADMATKRMKHINFFFFASSWYIFGLATNIHSVRSCWCYLLSAVVVSCAMYGNQTNHRTIFIGQRLLNSQSTLVHFAFGMLLS